MKAVGHRIYDLDGEGNLRITDAGSLEVLSTARRDPGPLGGGDDGHGARRQSATSSSPRVGSSSSAPRPRSPSRSTGDPSATRAGHHLPDRDVRRRRRPRRPDRHRPGARRGPARLCPPGGRRDPAGDDVRHGRPRVRDADHADVGDQGAGAEPAVRRLVGGRGLDPRLAAGGRGPDAAGALRAGPRARHLRRRRHDLDGHIPIGDRTFVPAATSILAPGDTLYAGLEKVAISSGVWVDPIDRDRLRFDDWQTAVHEFSFADGEAPGYEGSGIVDGSTVGQFAFGEIGNALGRGHHRRGRPGPRTPQERRRPRGPHARRRRGTRPDRRGRGPRRRRRRRQRRPLRRRPGAGLDRPVRTAGACRRRLRSGCSPPGRRGHRARRRRLLPPTARAPGTPHRIPLRRGRRPATSAAPGPGCRRTCSTWRPRRPADRQHLGAAVVGRPGRLGPPRLHLLARARLAMWGIQRPRRPSTAIGANHAACSDRRRGDRGGRPGGQQAERGAAAVPRVEITDPRPEEHGRPRRAGSALRRADRPESSGRATSATASTRARSPGSSPMTTRRHLRPSAPGTAADRLPGAGGRRPTDPAHRPDPRGPRPGDVRVRPDRLPPDGTELLLPLRWRSRRTRPRAIGGGHDTSRSGIRGGVVERGLSALQAPVGIGRSLTAEQCLE